jgi:hypothetical protein
MSTTTYTAEQMERMLIAGGRYNGVTNYQAAMHLLTYTELPHRQGFDDLVDIEEVRQLDGEKDTAAFVNDWAKLRKSRAAQYAGGGDNRLLALAEGLATRKPVNLVENTGGFGHAHGRRVAEAFLIATGAAEFYAVTPRPALGEMLAANEALFGPTS